MFRTIKQRVRFSKNKKNEKHIKDATIFYASVNSTSACCAICIFHVHKLSMVLLCVYTSFASSSIISIMTRQRHRINASHHRDEMKLMRYVISANVNEVNPLLDLIRSTVNNLINMYQNVSLN